MRVKVGVGPGKVLTVVDGKVHVVQSVVGRAVDVLFEPVTRNHVPVVDENSPDLYQYEES